MKSMKFLSLLVALLLCFMTVLALTVSADEAPAGETPAAAASESTVEETKDQTKAIKAIAASAAVGAVAVAAALGMAAVIRKTAESMARQPEAAGKLNSAMMLGLVFLETVVIYALIVAILVIFVL